MSQKEVDRLKNLIASNLISSARAYHKIGIELFHESRMKSWVDFQPAIGNLSISVELILKAVVAQKAIKLLYSNLSDEAQLLLCYPESLPKGHNAISQFNDLKHFAYKAIELDRAISIFCQFHPGIKQEYKLFFSMLAEIRNVSVHASVPDFQRYELERIAYYSTKLFMTIDELKVFKYFSFRIEKKTYHFMTYYKEEKIKKVKEALSKARDVVKKGKLSEPSHYSEDWENMNLACPICGNIGVCVGETEEITDENGIHLMFQCDNYSCEACGLELEDYEELTLAGMDTAIDRDDDVEKWVREHGYDDYDDRW